MWTVPLTLIKFRTVANFFEKWLSQVIMGNFFRNRDFRFKLRFEPFSIDFDQKNSFDQNFCLCHSFWPKIAKYRGFWRFLVEKKIFWKNVGTLSYNILLRFFWALILMCTYNIRWDNSNWASPCLLSCHYEFMILVRDWADNQNRYRR